MNYDSIPRESLTLSYGGKAEHVMVMKKGEPVNVCVCAWNADFDRGCVMHVNKDDLEEVFTNNGKYVDREAIFQKRGQVYQGCEYCYAWGWNKKPLKIREVNDKTRKSFEELLQATPNPKDRIVRIGVNSEPGHPIYRPELLKFMDLAKEYGAKVIMPTKALEFDPFVFQRFTDADSVINYSIAKDNSEPGPVSQGFTQEWRIEQAKMYHQAGANTSLTVICDYSSSIDRNAEMGYAIHEAIEANQKFGIPLRLLPMRVPNKKLAPRLTGRTGDELLSTLTQDDLFFTQSNSDFIDDASYVNKKGNHQLEIIKIHPDFKELYGQFDGEKIGACGRAGNKEYCDHCGIRGNTGKPPAYKVPIKHILSKKQADNLANNWDKPLVAEDLSSSEFEFEKYDGKGLPKGIFRKPFVKTKKKRV